MKKLSRIKTWTVSSIEVIARQRMPKMCHMNTNLMGSAGFDSNLEQRQRQGKFPEHLPIAHRMPPTTCQHRHFLPMLGVPSDGGYDSATLLPHPSMNQCLVFFGQTASLESLYQAPMDHFLFCNQHHPRGVFIEAMNNPRSRSLPYRGDRQAVVHQTIDQGLITITTAGMHHQSRRFRQCQQILILVENGKVYSLRYDVKRGWWLDKPTHHLSSFNPITALADHTVHSYQPFANGFGKKGTRGGRGHHGKELIKTYATTSI